MGITLKRIVTYIVGLFVLSLGVVLLIKADVGVAPWDALYVGLSKTIGLTVGSWIFIVGSFVIVINSMIKKGTTNILSLLPVLIIGFFVDILNLSILSFIEIEYVYTRWMLFLIGLFILASGIVFYIRASFPLVPNDGLMIAIMERTGWNIRVSKTIGESLALLLAYFFNGPIGIGTIVVTFSLGSLIQLVDNKMNRMGVKR